MNGLTGPPLYIDVDPKWRRFAFITCMDGSVYVIDGHSAIESPKRWTFQRLKDHKKYVVIGRWSKDSKYLLTAGHDHKAILYKFNINKDDDDDDDDNDDHSAGFKVMKVHQYEYGGCVEAICWITDCEFVISVRGSPHLEYYKIDEKADSKLIDDGDIGSLSYLHPMMRCNVNAFGDQHISFSIGDIRVSRDGHFILAKTDHEKVLLMIAKSEETLNTLYGSHSDQYSYTRCCFSAEEKFVYGSHHNDYVIWDVVTGKLIHRQSNAHQKTLRDMCFDTKRGVIVTASFDRTIKIWAP